MQSYYRVSLEDLLGRNLNVQWFEGVAVVQGVCRQVLADGSAERGFPSLAEVFVCAHGAIEITGTASPSQSVAAAGHALNQMLGEDAPVRLRLVATQATAGDVVYHTLGQFSEAIAYFERPDPEGILRHLHQRFWDAELGSDAPQELVPADEQEQTAEPEQTTEPEQRAKPEQAARPEQTVKPAQTANPAHKPEQPQQPAKKGRRTALVLAGIAAAVILCLSAAVLLLLPVSSEGTAASAVATVQNVVRSTLARVAPAAPAKTDDVKPEKVNTNTLGKQASRRIPREKPRNDAQDRTRRNVSPDRQAALPLPWLRPVPTTEWSRPDVFFDVPQDESRPPFLYSALNTEVVPPRSVYPKLPANPPSGFSVPGQTVLEMVIGTNGLVERVKLRSDPRNVHEFMLVSAAKAWQFEPARLDGTPVRYLHTVVLTLQ